MRKFCGPILSGTTAVAVFGCAVPAVAQSGESVSRPVVQPLPPPGVASLGDALRRLARDARNVDALIDAGNASLELNDVEAAIGFFGRAQDLSPGNARVKLGLAGAFVRSGRPIDALRLFDEAERAGASTAAFASERGLAYDLVGDNAAAQAQYRQALAAGEDPEIVRRLAISQAIAGDREGFERTLYPQLEREDYAGFRTRAFGLAILGDEEEAVAIAETVMPPDLSAQIAPYLRYMGRLTKAQQAAAVNLGAFPRAAQIGRDDPRIAQYSAGSSGTGSSPATAGAGSRLAPAGAPLGPPTGQPAGDELPPVAQTDAPPATVSRPVVQSVPGQTAVSSSQPATEGAAVRALSAPEAPTALVASTGAAAPAPGFDLAAAARGAAPSSATPPAEDPIPANVADAFASFELGPAPGFARSADAVDITLIDPPREIEMKPAAVPEPPKHPSRFWVQVATGRNIAAFRYDWRRISQKAPDVLGDFKPMTTPWVEANRLLAGPFETEKAAQDAVRKLREAGIDSFTFTSEEGQEILPLG